jgi:hypothetical protein
LNNLPLVMMMMMMMIMIMMMMVMVMMMQAIAFMGHVHVDGQKQAMVCLAARLHLDNTHEVGRIQEIEARIWVKHGMHVQKMQAHTKHDHTPNATQMC